MIAEMGIYKESMMLREFDIIMAKKDINSNIKRGCRGVVLIVYERPALAYEVEFMDDNNDTIDVTTVEPSDIKLCWRQGQ
ncbi:DUF4926 domain-containing protein [Anaerovorax odorimutans]|uniref:DUF4926 domain-containing protein n=1 Tax=Anaerovorax odorimutans TaxID=109327 RepID=A0ABT1RRG4_9FIRM|nr:DUF4926 domain-containing protein [Anaerovorax odorimutans]MCQ4637783.1 DUF4926 domain-containing protein [Anaerovorax odorimutans]